MGLVGVYEKVRRETTIMSIGIKGVSRHLRSAVE